MNPTSNSRTGSQQLTSMWSLFASKAPDQGWQREDTSICQEKTGPTKGAACTQPVGHAGHTQKQGPGNQQLTCRIPAKIPPTTSLINHMGHVCREPQTRLDQQP